MVGDEQQLPQVGLAGPVGNAREEVHAPVPRHRLQCLAVARGADSAITRREFAWRIAAQSGAMENRLQIAQRFEEECR